MVSQVQRAEIQSVYYTSSPICWMLQLTRTLKCTAQFRTDDSSSLAPFGNCWKHWSLSSSSSFVASILPSFAACHRDRGVVIYCLDWYKMMDCSDLPLCLDFTMHCVDYFSSQHLLNVMYAPGLDVIGTIGWVQTIQCRVIKKMNRAVFQRDADSYL